jgi:hypothetical protein
VISGLRDLGESMHQLVGSLCVICGESIQDLLEGTICEGCQNAVHNRCAKRVRAQLGEDYCHFCGADLVRATFLTRREQRERLVRKAPNRSYPVSKVCPKCANTEYKRRKPDKWIAFTADRVCTACQTRYTPPTPTWAGVVFILVGLALAGVGFLGVIIGLLRGLEGVPAMICEGSVGVIGVLAMVHGVKSLINQGMV